MIPINDLSRSFQLYQEEYEAKALEVLRSGWYILGKEVSAFEEEFAKALSPDCYCAGVDNGLDAILVGLMAAGIQPGDEIIVQANGYIATMLGIIQCGAVPVFVEPDEYYQINADLIEEKINEKTKANLTSLRTKGRIQVYLEMPPSSAFTRQRIWEVLETEAASYQKTGRLSTV